MDQPGFSTVSYFVIEQSGQEVLVSPALETRPVFNIGSDPRSQLHLDDPDVASGHAVVSRNGEEYFIQPLYKARPVLVNGKSISVPTRLNTDDVVQIGSTTLRFEQQQRRAQAITVKPASSASAALPASTAASLVPVTTSAGRVIMPAAPASATIYRPKTRRESGNGIFFTLLLLLGGIGVVLVIGYNLVTGGNVAAPTPEPRAIDYAYNDGNIAVLWFDLPDCEECHLEKSVVNQVVEEFRGDVYLQSYTMDKPGYAWLIEKYELVTVPTIVILDDEGQVFYTLTGANSPDTLRAALQAALEQSAGN